MSEAVKVKQANVQLKSMEGDSLDQKFTLHLMTEVGPATYELDIPGVTLLCLSALNVVKPAVAAVRREHPEKFQGFGMGDV